MWYKLEKIYKKNIKQMGGKAIHLINVVICLKISNKDHVLNSFKKFKNEVIKSKLDLILDVKIDESWRINFSKVVDDLKSIEINNETDIKNIGYLFEKLVNRKKRGTYYTPSDVTHYIVEKVIIGLILARLNETKQIDVFNKINFKDKFIKSLNSKKTIRKSIKIIKDLKILDPTCGSGAFLLTAFDIIFEMLINLEKKLHSNIDKKKIAVLTLKTLHGVDIESRAIVITKSLLLMEVLIVDGKRGLSKFPWDNFKVGNSLWGDISSISENEYFKKVNDQQLFNKTNEKPFLWKKEFKGKKFDCIIGNPPYIELTQAKLNHSIDPGFKVLNCGNVYSLVLERSNNLLKDDGLLGMILPISFLSTKRMVPIFQKIQNTSEYLYVASFGDRPSCLFSGVHQKLNIIIAKNGKGGCLFTSSYFHWYKDEREELFSKIKFIRNKKKLKIGTNIEKSIVSKVNKHTDPLFSYFSKTVTPYYIYLNVRAAFFIKTSLLHQESKEFKKIYFNSKKACQVINAILNSNLVFMLWEIFGDGWHLQPQLDFVKLDWDKMNAQVLNKLVILSKEINNSLEKTKVKINSKQTKYEYKHKLSKKIMDKIDEVLSHAYGFTKEEVLYLKQYNAKYRLNNYFEEYLIS